MALDEPNNFDEVFTVGGFTYLVDKRLLPAIRPIMVDFNTEGFSVTGGHSDAFGQCGI
jgi:hypothetical protein